MRKFFYRYVQLSLLLSLVLSCGVPCLSANVLTPKRSKCSSGVEYTWYEQGNFNFDFAIRRPLPRNSDICLVVPCAFTTPDNQIDGIAICNGVRIGSVNHELGGAAVFQQGKCTLLDSGKGTLLNEKFLTAVQKHKGSLLQQFLIVHNGKAANFKDKSKFQRRAIYETTRGRFGVIESTTPVSFETFNNDLVEMGIKEALYCDMGAWDEGWYRATTDKVVTIGLDRSRTFRQSNWVLLRKPPERQTQLAKPNSKGLHRHR